MSVGLEAPQQGQPAPPQPSGDEGLDRRADIEGKQSAIGALLLESACDGLLILLPENFNWLTSGASSRGVLNPTEQPALYFSGDQRWLLAANVDSQRLFDEELLGLGFQLKEWPWFWGRAQLLADLCQGRTVACDLPLGQCKPLGEPLKRLRMTMSAYEQACIKALGQILAHALEATCRSVNVNDTEREIAGQLGYRLLHRGAQVVDVEVAVDGRSRLYRQCGYTAVQMQKYAVISATARKYGLCATASRSVCFGPPEPQFHREHEAACKVCATYIASCWPDALPSQILQTGKKVYELTGFEHDWRLSPQGHLTGRAPVEAPLLPHTEGLFQAGFALTWRASVGAALSCDSFLITEQGPRNLTPVELWPAKRIRVQGADFFRPDILYR